jgi:hypothetical protein
MILMIIVGTSMSAILMILIVIMLGLTYPLNASVPSMVGQSIFGGKDFAAISAQLMTAVYIGQFLCAPITSVFLGMNNGWSVAWGFYAAAAVVGLLLIFVAVKKSPLKK